MPDYSIRNNCHINTNWDTDTFVGIKSENGRCEVNFPLGFHISEDDKGLRRDILLLIYTLSAMSERMDSTISELAKEQNSTGFPIQAYLFLISDYYRKGYYKEKEIRYVSSTRGKIDWTRTIKQQKPYVQGTDAFYLTFTTRKNPLNENELITLIHEYCVYESFCKIGWLFTAAIPKKPRLKFNKKLFKRVVFEKYSNTFNEYNKELFSNMLLVIDHLTDPNAPMKYIYGVDPFDHTWEALVDRVFGIADKADYFPKTTWHIGDTDFENSELRPDSIMLWNGNVFVLDAKNYKYGKTKRPGDLPQSADINKQITYAEYIAEQEKFRKKHGEQFVTYNAFIMPYDAALWPSTSPIKWIGDATANWKKGRQIYERVQGILVDVKELMKAATHNISMVMELASVIEEAVDSKSS